MLRVWIATTCLFVIFAAKPQSAATPSWRQFVPGRTTKAEVEQTLGTSANGYSATYNLKEGNLFIGYSSGPCGKEKKGGWNVPKNTVVVITFTPQKKMSLSELRLNRKRLRKVVDKHAVGVTYYIDDRNNITYDVQKGKVDAITYEPPMKLYCGDSDLLRKSRY